MIAKSEEAGPFGGINSYTVLGGCDKGGNECFILSAYFNVSYTKEEVTEPKWWQFWKKPVTTYIDGCKRWERKSCMLYGWQVESIGDLDFRRNQMLQTLLFVLGGGVQQICGVQLEPVIGQSPYVLTSN